MEVPLPARVCWDVPAKISGLLGATVTVPLLVKLLPVKVVLVLELEKLSVAPDATSMLPPCVPLRPMIIVPAFTIMLPELEKGESIFKDEPPDLVRLPPLCTSNAVVPAPEILALDAELKSKTPPFTTTIFAVLNKETPAPLEKLAVPPMRSSLLPETELELAELAVIEPETVTTPLPATVPPNQMKPLAKVGLPVP